MKRVVIDTGVIVSALIKKEGISRIAFLTAIEVCVPLIAVDTLIELEEVLSRPKFNRFFSSEDQVSIIASIIDRGQLIEVNSSVELCRDSTDNKFINLALDGKADVILSGDPDLLSLNSISNILVLNPSDFLVWIKQSNS